MFNQVYDINNMIIFALVGLCIKMFFGGTPSQDGSTGKASSTVWGYTIVALAILGIMVISFALASQNSMTTCITGGKWDFFKGLMTESFPSVFTLIVLIWIIVINLNYYKRINQGRVATEYYMFSNATATLLIFQLIALFKYLNGRFKASELKERGRTAEEALITKDNDRYAFAIYFVTLLNCVLAGIMNITLEFFSTDG